MMAGENQPVMSCSEFEALLTDALDGALGGATRERFAQHRAGCPICRLAFAEAEAGKGWLAALAEVEPPRMLAHNIIAATSGAKAEVAAGRTSWIDRLPAPFRPVLQPRFAMSFAMAFFSLSIVFNLAGIRLGDLRAADLRPSALGNLAVSTLAQTQGRIVKYYESMRLVYEIESRMRALRNASEEPPQPQPKPREPEKRNQNEKTSGHPDQKENDRYVWELLNNTWATVGAPVWVGSR